MARSAPSSSPTPGASPTASRAIDFFEQPAGCRIVVAVNHFEGAAKYHLEDIREALAVSRGVPMINADVRSRASAKEILVAVTEHALAQRTGVRR